MICSFCHKKIKHEYRAICITIDGDFVCDEECKKGWEKERDHFFNVTIHDDNLFADWMIEGMHPETKKIVKEIIAGG